MATTLADLRVATLELAEELLAVSSQERTPELEQRARRDAFVTVLFQVLLGQSGDEGLDARALNDAWRLYWRDIRNGLLVDEDWKATLVEALGCAGDNQRRREGTYDPFWNPSEGRYDD